MSIAYAVKKRKTGDFRKSIIIRLQGAATSFLPSDAAKPIRGERPYSAA